MGQKIPITEGSREDSRLLEQCATLSAMLEGAAFPAFSLDRQYRYTSFNRAHAATMKRLHGKDVQLGHSLVEYQTVPEDWQRTKSNLDRVLRGESFVDFDFVGTDDLTRRYFEIVFNPIRDGSGEITGASVFTFDVTERKRAEWALREREVQLREAQRLARLGSWEWMVGSNSITWSEGLHLILGRDVELGAPSFNTLPRFYTQESWERLRLAIEKAIDTGVPYELEIAMVRHDGTTCWTITRGEAVRGPTGAVVKLRGTAHDITERRRAEQERERLVTALREADQHKNELLGVLSRELRDPLTSIRNSLYILQQATPDEEQARRAKAVIDRQVTHLTRLVDDLLDVNRINA